MDIVSSEDSTTMVTDDHPTFHPTPRKSLLDILGASADQGHNLKATITQTQDPAVLEPIVTSPLSASSSKLILPRPESRLSSISRQLPAAVDLPRADPALSRASAAPEVHTYELPDSDMVDLYADPNSPSRSPLSLFSDLSEAVRESAELDRITSLHHLLTAEREELLARHEETTRALSRTKTQLDRVLSLTDEAIQMTTVFVDKEKTLLETKKMKAEAEIERRKNLEAEQRRKAKDLERIRQHEEERKAQVEMEQQAERQRLEEQRRKEEALAAERLRQEELQAEERRRLEEDRSRTQEEERRLAEEDRKKRDEEERKRQAEEEQQEEEERLRRKLDEREALARKQDEDRRTQLLERRRLAEEERRRKELETAAAAKAEAERRAAEKEQQRIFQERRSTVLKDKYKNYNRPGSGVPPTGLPSTLEGTSSFNPLSIVVNDVPTNLQAFVELDKIYRTRETPTFVPATTEAGRLPPDLSQQIKVSDGLVDHAVKHETTSPVITPVDNTQPVEGTPPTQLPPRSLPSISNFAPAPAPASLPAPPHLPAKPVAIHSQPPASTSLQQRGRTPPRRHLRSRSRSSSRSPRRGSPISRIPSRTSRSPESARGRYGSPPAARRGDHYSPPRQFYRDGGSRYDRDSRSDSPPPPQNPRKRTLPGAWGTASTPSKLDYSHPAKRRAASPLRSRSPPSPPSRPLTHPPPVVSIRRPPPPSRRRGGGPPNHVPLEQRLSRQPQLSDRIR